MDIARLELSGVNYGKGVERFLGDAELYEIVLMSFLDSDMLTRAEKAYEDKNYKALFECAHETKGASGNTDMEMLYRISCVLTELLRNGEPEADAVQAAFIQFRDIYQATLRAIREAAEN
ncbi:MAG: Hpt domain-containing protein [Bacillota bacterium]|nr:Hpt domain-containing protein [Bacillota bacterium]